MKPLIAFILVSILTDCVFIGSRASAMGSISFMLFVKEVYDSNVFLREDTLRKEDDFITELAPGVTAFYIGKRFNATLSYQSALRFYSEFNENNSTKDHSGTFNLNSRVSKNIDLNLEDNLSFIAKEKQLTQNDFEDDPDNQEGDNPDLNRLEPEENVLTEISTDILSNNAGANLSYKNLPSGSLDVGYSYSITHYSENSLTDSEKHNVFLNSGYMLNRQTWFNLEAVYNEFIFEDTGSEATYELKGRTTYDFSGFFSTSFSAGLVYIDEDNSLKWVAGVNIDKKFKKSVVTAFYQRGVKETRGKGGASITQSVSLTYETPWGKDLRSTLSGNYIHSKSITGQANRTQNYNIKTGLKMIVGKKSQINTTYGFSYQEDDNILNGVIRIHQFSLGNNYQLNRYFGINASYTYFYRKDFEKDGPVRDNRIILGVQLLW